MEKIETNLKPHGVKSKVFIEMHSEEMHEVIGTPPFWLIRWGATFYLLIIVFFILTCWFIKYPDIISVPIALISTNAPRSIVARSEGKLVRILVTDQEKVIAGKVLGFLESTANPEKVLELDVKINNLAIFNEQDRWSKMDFHVNAFNELGELQNDFQTFSESFLEAQLSSPNGYNIIKKKLLFADIEDLKQLESNLTEQIDLQKEGYKIGENEHLIQEKLFNERVISPLDYQREKEKLLNKEIPIKAMMFALIQNRTLQNAKQKELIELDQKILQGKNNFAMALKTLKSNIESWKSKYLIIAPVTGTISFVEPWQEQQNIKIGQDLMTVEPSTDNIRGLIQISQEGLGKITLGQEVHVKLDGYPYGEFGVLNGKLAYISSSPGKDGEYWGYVSLPPKLQTNYQYIIKYRNGMKGKADIITSDRRLIHRFVSLLNFGRAASAHKK